MVLQKRILVVEDSLVVLRVLYHLLSQNSIFTPVLCASYKEAENELKAPEQSFFDGKL